MKYCALSAGCGNQRSSRSFPVAVAVGPDEEVARELEPDRGRLTNLDLPRNPDEEASVVEFPRESRAGAVEDSVDPERMKAELRAEPGVVTSAHEIESEEALRRALRHDRLGGRELRLPPLALDERDVDVDQQVPRLREGPSLPPDRLIGNGHRVDGVLVPLDLVELVVPDEAAEQLALRLDGVEEVAGPFLSTQLRDHDRAARLVQRLFDQQVVPCGPFRIREFPPVAGQLLGELRRFPFADNRRENDPFREQVEALEFPFHENRAVGALRRPSAELLRLEQQQRLLVAVGRPIAVEPPAAEEDSRGFAADEKRCGQPPFQGEGHVREDDRQVPNLRDSAERRVPVCLRERPEVVRRRT